MSRKLDVNLNQMFDLICNFYGDVRGGHMIAPMVGNFADSEVYAYINDCAGQDGFSPEEAARRLNALASFRESYCEDLES